MASGRRSLRRPVLNMTRKPYVEIARNDNPDAPIEVRYIAVFTRFGVSATGCTPKEAARAAENKLTKELEALKNELAEWGFL